MRFLSSSSVFGIHLSDRAKAAVSANLKTILTRSGKVPLATVPRSVAAAAAPAVRTAVRPPASAGKSAPPKPARKFVYQPLFRGIGAGRASVSEKVKAVDPARVKALAAEFKAAEDAKVDAMWTAAFARANPHLASASKDASSRGDTSDHGARWDAAFRRASGIRNR